MIEYILDLVETSRHHDDLHLGVSPLAATRWPWRAKAAQASAVLNSRDYVTPDDIKQLFLPVCVHRVVSKTYLHNGDANATSRILQSILDKVAAAR